MAELSRRFLETTRGQVLGLLRCGSRTVEELAGELALTDNAIRAHLATLERDGLVAQAGQRRGPGAGKPALVYQLTADVEERLSRAYPPVLTALVEELAEALPPARTAALLQRAGRRLAAALPPGSGSLEARTRHAAELLNQLGAEVSVARSGPGYTIKGCGCPLSATVARRPETCRAIQALLSEVIGVGVRACCEHGARPRCCFTVPPAG